MNREETTIDYSYSEPIILNIEHEGCEPSLINGKWQVTDSRVVSRAADKTPNDIIIRLWKVDDI